MKKRSHFPAFGSWDYCDEHSFTQYLESAAAPAAGEDADRRRHHHHHLMKKGQQKKQGKVCDVVRAQATPKRSSRARKAVDEDLYQIPPELLYKEPKRQQKGLLRMMWSGLNCICIA